MSTIDESQKRLSEFKFVLDGDPVPLARARFSKHGVWDAQRKIKHEMSQLLEDQFGDRPLLSGPLSFDIIFFFRIPPSWSISKKSRAANAFHQFKPDLSNLIKFVEDVANGIIYKDDCIISSIHAIKTYGYTPRTECFIKEIGNVRKDLCGQNGEEKF